MVFWSVVYVLFGIAPKRTKKVWFIQSCFPAYPPHARWIKGPARYGSNHWQVISYLRHFFDWDVRCLATDRLSLTGLDWINGPARWLLLHIRIFRVGMLKAIPLSLWLWVFNSHWQARSDDLILKMVV